jgi:hypothetical protein
MIPDLKCPKCQDEMVQGFIPKDTPNASTWVESQPKKSMLGGIIVKFKKGIPIDRRQLH